MSGPAPGQHLTWALTTHKGSIWTEEEFEKDYKENHMPRAVAPDGNPFGVRYKNVEPDAKYTMLALYEPDDPASLALPDVQALMKEQQDAKITFDVALYTNLQRFEGQEPKTGDYGKILVSVKMEPATGTDAELDDWYRKQHLDMLSMVQGYRRSTRWKLTPMGELPEGTPTYLALHEFDALPPPEQMKLVIGTEWSKKVLGSAKAFVRDVWQLADVQGESRKL